MSAESRRATRDDDVQELARFYAETPMLADPTGSYLGSNEYKGHEAAATKIIAGVNPKLVEQILLGLNHSVGQPSKMTLKRRREAGEVDGNYIEHRVRPQFYNFLPAAAVPELGIVEAQSGHYAMWNSTLFNTFAEPILEAAMLRMINSGNLQFQEGAQRAIGTGRPQLGLNYTDEPRIYFESYPNRATDDQLEAEMNSVLDSIRDALRPFVEEALRDHRLVRDSITYANSFTRLKHSADRQTNLPIYKQIREATETELDHEIAAQLFEAYLNALQSSQLPPVTIGLMSIEDALDNAGATGLYTRAHNDQDGNPIPAHIDIAITQYGAVTPGRYSEGVFRTQEEIRKTVAHEYAHHILAFWQTNPDQTVTINGRELKNVGDHNLLFRQIEADCLRTLNQVQTLMVMDRNGNMEIQHFAPQNPVSRGISMVSVRNRDYQGFQDDYEVFTNLSHYMHQGINAVWNWHSLDLDALTGRNPGVVAAVQTFLQECNLENGGLTPANIDLVIRHADSKLHTQQLLLLAGSRSNFWNDIVANHAEQMDQIEAHLGLIALRDIAIFVREHAEPVRRLENNTYIDDDNIKYKLYRLLHMMEDYERQIKETYNHINGVTAVNSEQPVQEPSSAPTLLTTPDPINAAETSLPNRRTASGTNENAGLRTSLNEVLAALARVTGHSTRTRYFVYTLLAATIGSFAFSGWVDYRTHNLESRIQRLEDKNRSAKPDRKGQVNASTDKTTPQKSRNSSKKKSGRR